MAFDIQDWGDYAAVMAEISATLVGLLFVSVSINSTWFSSSKEHRGRAGQALVLFLVPVLTSIMLLIPGQSTTAVGIEIAAFGLLVGCVLAALPTPETKDEPRAMVVIDRLSFRWLVTVMLIVCGASLIAERFGGNLLAGGRSAWVFLLVAGARTGE